MTELIAAVARFWRRYWVEVAWSLFVAANVVGILTFREWATVPFHFIWIGLSFLYGWRIWEPRVTAGILTVIIAVTGLSLLQDVFTGDQAVDELTEIPLMSAVFVAMVWYVRWSVASQRETQRMSERNMSLLHQERQFIQEASHALRTPLTIALGHAELLQRTTSDVGAAEDAQVVIGELNRLKKITDRLLALAASQQPDFVRTTRTSVREMVTRTLTRWEGTSPAVRPGTIDDAVVALDPDRIVEAMDELIGNAIAHNPVGTPVEVSARRTVESLVLSITDHGLGIPQDRLAMIFDRWVRLNDEHAGGVGLGLGLAIVQAIANAHGGSAVVRSRPREGTTFEIHLPLAAIAGSSGAVDPVWAMRQRAVD